ncbi:putative helicase UvrD, partial [Paenibacillus agaridevorans]
GSGRGRDSAAASPESRGGGALRDRTQLKAGLSVRHRVFGPGIIAKVAGDGIEILFGETNMKSLSVAMCLNKGLLEPID